MSYYNDLPDSEKEKLQIVDVPIKDFLIEIVNTIYKEGYNEDKSELFLEIENKVFTENINFSADFPYHVEFKNCYFQRHVSFYKTAISSLLIKDCFFDKEIAIGPGVVFKEEFYIINLSTKDAFNVSAGKYSKCKWSFATNSDLNISGGEYDDLTIGFYEQAKFKTVSIDFRNIKGHINICGHQTQIQSLLLSNFAPDVSVNIEDISVNRLLIHRFKNEKGFRINNIKTLNHNEQTEFSIYSSSLGKAELYSINFKSFKHFYILDSQLTDCSFVNVDWNFNIKAFKGSNVGKTEEEKLLFEKIKLIENNNFNESDEIEELREDDEVKEYYRKLRENYRQLKFAVGKQGDTINEQKFHSREMMTYNKSITIEEHFGTKMIVNLSYWFSDFGQSLGRPLIALIIGHWLLLILLIHFEGIPNLTISVFNGNIEGFKIAFINYFKLINPLRRMDEVKDCTVIIEIFMRIWSSYMIYNIIRATRRFIK